jgi:hypothetical protein
MWLGISGCVRLLCDRVGPAIRPRLHCGIFTLPPTTSLSLFLLLPPDTDDDFPSASFLTDG